MNLNTQNIDKNADIVRQILVILIRLFAVWIILYIVQEVCRV